VEVILTTPQGANDPAGTQNDYTYQAAAAPQSFKLPVPMVSRED
jgi:hypothetical protein